MIVYNVTVNVDEEIHENWLDWMTTKHIPQVMETGCFTGSEIFRLLSPETEEGVTYSIQYYANDLEEYEKYQIEHAAFLQSETKEKFGGRYTAFRSVLEKV
ncbi:MAG: DUF4286 family protein [Ignavibacteriae bacterium]|nr:MAG: DUF4286 family protein [Ignavibacteriota bacterium]